MRFSPLYDRMTRTLRRVVDRHDPADGVAMAMPGFASRDAEDRNMIWPTVPLPADEPHQPDRVATQAVAPTPEPDPMPDTHTQSQRPEAATMPLIEVYSRFESLGNNCEFGIVQRSVGYDPPGLFRNVGFLDVEQIIGAVSRNFEGMFEDGRYELTAPDGWLDWRLDCQVFGFMFHTGIALTVTRDSPEWTKAVADMLPVFEFLKQKLQEDLTTANKMFVFRSLQNTPSDTAQRLLDALRQHGPNTLLYVRQDPTRPTGTLRSHGNGLVEASLSRLSNENPPRIEFDTWERMARTLLGAPAPSSRPELSHAAASSGPAAAAAASNPPAFAVPVAPPLVNTPPLIHPFGATASTAVDEVAVSFDLEDLEPGTALTAQTWIWLPGGLEFDQVDFICIGYPTEAALLPYLSRHDAWQLVSVSTRVPPGQFRAVPALCVRGPVAGHFFSAGWSFRLGEADAT